MFNDGVEETQVSGTNPEMDEQCCAHCQANPDCEYWVREDPGTTCWLKKNFIRHPIIDLGNRRGAFRVDVPTTSEEPTTIPTADPANTTIPCDTAVWTAAGIAELTTEGSLKQFGYPAVGSTLTDSKRARIKNFDGSISAGFISCFGSGSDWTQSAGMKCTGKTKVLAECDDPRSDAGWEYFSKQWTPWCNKTPNKKCTGKRRKWFLVHSHYQCQLKAESMGHPYYTYKGGLIKKCSVTPKCDFSFASLGVP